MDDLVGASSSSSMAAASSSSYGCVTITKDDIKVFVMVPSKSSTEFPNAAWWMNAEGIDAMGHGTHLNYGNDYRRMDEHDQYESVGLDDSLEDERNLDETMAD
ncbi:hypothetical protein ZEAMMB73_Zm00001d047411 [Zea mays]|uniref:Uncharacterized protein n=1 Tax=Zea mays TaxID=4577 RepID=A0A1D6P990_MAIZE|nr:hypothetical protein ZEAMMB73_Zm00001d047411 [Zea mays]AQL06362.1 hypothetical protein ZEAMMB73_Zm00001d047411 [Zea mays]AQL06363.1 hypothetical protein ZEAMMB73_Zm00001d047411 [Zea mays]